jgi:predicted RNA-binding Zn-ribbon protein involved in translation (DUF1610 family)
MPTESGPHRQAEAAPGTVKEETLEAMLKDFPCEACGDYRICRTERESWYTCVNCGYSFGIEPHPKRRLRRATDFVGIGSISH